MCNIPENEGIYGVHESGGPLVKPDTLESRNFRIKMKRDINTGISGIESGGIELGRPLLSFSKNRLIATCEKFSIPWVEDETNKDRTLTSRNAIRHVLQHHKLPAALSRNALLKLHTAKMEQKTKAKAAVEEYFSKCNIKLDVRTGSLTAVVPKWSTDNFDEIHNAKGLLGKRLASLVSPHPRLLVSKFAVFANGSEPTFTAGGVLFTRGESSSDQATWTLRRQQAYGSDESTLTTFPRVQQKPREITIPSPFQLWDGRFWIQIQKPPTHTVSVRALRRADLRTIRQLLHESKIMLQRTSGAGDGRKITFSWKKYLDDTLREVAQGMARFTLPVIVTSGEKDGLESPEGEQGKEMVLAFPTLGLRLLNKSGWVGFPQWTDRLRWEVRYKSVDLGSKRVEDCIVGLE